MSFKQESKQELKDREFSSAHQKFEYWVRHAESHTDNMFDKEEHFILTDSEKMVAGDIIRDYRMKMTDFSAFLNRQYFEFDYKIQRCSYQRCYSDIFKQPKEIHACMDLCYNGAEKADAFVADQLSEFNLTLNTCLDKSQKHTKDIMNETFKCFNDMLNSFTALKRTVKTEFDFYQ